MSIAFGTSYVYLIIRQLMSLFSGHLCASVLGASLYICFQGILCAATFGASLYICFRIILRAATFRASFVYVYQLLFTTGMCDILQVRYIIFLIFIHSR